MKTLHVGGFNPLSRYKTFEDALNNASDDDTIVLHKNVTVSSIIDKNILIDGNGKTMTIETTKAGLVCNQPIMINNLNFRVHSRANALILNAGGELTNVTTEIQGPLRAFYPTIMLKQGDLKIQDSRITKLQTVIGSHVEILDSVVFGYYGGDVYLSTHADHSHIQGTSSVENSELSSITFDNQVYIGHSAINKYVTIKSDAEIVKCVLSGKTEKERVNMNKEPSSGPLRERVMSKFSLHIEDASVKIDNYTNDTSDDYLGIYAVNSRIEVLRTENSDGHGVHLIQDSTLSFVDSHDTNYWSLESSITSLVRSEANLSAQTETAKEKLDKLIGLQNVKATIDSIMNTITVNQKNQDKNFEFSYHMIFAGDPGTGKTTVAEIVAQALYEVGAIPENKYTSTSVADLIKGYVGQTASNVKDIVQSAVGGVLFIDEAYELSVNDNTNSFNSEALSVLIAEMEQHRSDLVVIAAGYTKEMQAFMASNVGLSRRFQWIEFEDYTAKEMSEIFELIRQSYNQEYEVTHLANGLEQLFDKLISINLQIPDAKGRITNGGNGGLVRNVYQRVMQKRNDRISTNSQAIQAITKDDLLFGFKGEMEKAMQRQLE